MGDCVIVLVFQHTLRLSVLHLDGPPYPYFWKRQHKPGAVFFAIYETLINYNFVFLTPDDTISSS